jgi:serine protease Do/serine protease DegQ
VRVGIQLDFSSGEGAVEKVLEDSAAERAGVLAGDVLLRLDETKIGDMSDVVIHLKSKRVGDTVTLGIRRDGEEMTLETTFTEPAG